MPLAVVFLLFAAACAVQAAAHGGWAWLLLWPAASFLVVAVAYGGAGPRVLGKRPATGSVHPAATAALLPYFLLAHVGWHAVARLRGSRDASRVTPKLWVGRRPRLRDLPPDVTAVVDLTSEFPAARGIVGGGGGGGGSGGVGSGGGGRRLTYRSFPILDGHVPPVADLVAVARAVAGDPGVVYLHCAQGFGRAALVAACVLLASGDAADPAAAVARVRAARPGVRLSRGQQATLRRAAAELAKAGSAGVAAATMSLGTPPHRSGGSQATT